MLNLIEDRRWKVGNDRKDKKGEIIYTGSRGELVIDYVISKSEDMR